jgi:hypothetical protein
LYDNYPFPCATAITLAYVTTITLAYVTTITLTYVTAITLTYVTTITLTYVTTITLTILSYCLNIVEYYPKQNILFDEQASTIAIMQWIVGQLFFYCNGEL